LRVGGNRVKKEGEKTIPGMIPGPLFFSPQPAKKKERKKKKKK
jgi:hypothetical protein